jgi:hypothetical protein
MFFGNELDSDKHLLLDSTNRVLLVSQDRTMLEVVCKCVPDQFVIVTLDNTIHKAITNLNCLILVYSGGFRINMDITNSVITLQTKLLWLYKVMDDMRKCLFNLIDMQKGLDENSETYQLMLEQRDAYVEKYPEDTFVAYLYEVDACLYTADYRSMYDFEIEAIKMFNRIDFSSDIDSIKSAMTEQVETTYIQNYTHLHNTFKDFFKESINQ